MTESDHNTGEEGGDRPPQSGFRPLLRNSWILFSHAVTTLLALFLPAFLVLSLIQAGTIAVLDDAAIPELLGASISVAVLFVLAGIVGSFVVALAALIAEGERTGEPATIGDAWRAVRPLTREILGAALLAAVVAMAMWFVGLYQILLPVFFGPPVIVHAIALEGLPLSGAWPRAKVLLRGNWGRALLYLAVISLAIRLVGGLLSAGVIETFGDLAEDTTNFLLAGPVRGVVDGITLPFLAVAMYVLYRQLAGESESSPE